MFAKLPRCLFSFLNIEEKVVVEGVESAVDLCRMEEEDSADSLCNIKKEVFKDNHSNLLFENIPDIEVIFENTSACLSGPRWVS